MDAELDEDTGHGGTDLAGVGRIGLGPADILDRRLVVVNGNLADLTVHLVEHLTLAGVLGERTDSKELENEDLALLELDVELLADLGPGQEVLGRKDGEITVLGHELFVVLEDLGIHDVAGDIALGGAAELASELLADLGEVDRLEEETGAGVELATATESLGTERLGETTVGLAHHTLEELEDGAGEVELASAGQDIILVQLVGNHELSQVTNDLGGRGDLDNVTEEVVGLLVGLLGLEPLGAEAELRSLEHHVGELTARNLVLVNLRIGTSEVGFEGRVEETELRPVGVKSTDVLDVETSVFVSAIKRSNDGVNAGLRGHARQAVSGSINGISTSHGASNHGSDTSTRRVVGVDVDGEVGVLLADAADKEGGSVGLENTSHILDTKDINVESDKVVNELEIVFKVILLVGVKHVTAVANGTLANTAGLLDSLDTNLELVDVVEGIEDTEDIDTVLLGLLDEVLNGIVGQRSVGNTVSATEEHLEGNVGHKLAHLAESVPRILIEEAHGDIEGGATPALQGVQVVEGMAGLLGNVQQIDGTNTGSKERLVGITPGGVHEKAALVVADSLGEGLGTLLKDDLAPAFGAGLADIDLLAGSIVKLGDNDITLELGLTDLALDAAAVDGDVTEISKKLLSTVLAANEVEERRGIIDEGSPAVALDESRVSEKRSQERNIGLDAANAEFNQSTQNLSSGYLVG